MLQLLCDGLRLKLELGFVVAKFGRILVLLALVCRLEVRGVEGLAHLAVSHVIYVAPATSNIVIGGQNSGTEIGRSLLLIYGK